MLKRTINTCAIASTITAAITITATVASGAIASAHAEPPRTPRGATGSFEFSSAEPLRAKPVRDSASPILVRVNAVGDDRYRVEYLGTVEGAFDLAPSIERTDGRAPASLPDLRVEIYSQLPPNHGTDVFGLSAPGFSLAAHYPTALGAVAALWASVPAYFLVRRMMRRKPEPAPDAPPEPTVAERLFAIVDDARDRELDTDEKGRLELLVLRALRADGGHAALSDAIAALRDDRATARIVRAIEAWLHAPTPGDRAQALEAIDALRLGIPLRGGPT
ncbi:MAG: hypothetical protein ACO31E_10460 [Phycisphaerales bacterium]